MVVAVASVVVVVAVLIKMDWPGGGTPEVIVQNWGTVMLWRWRWRWWMWMERWRMLVERCSTVMNDSMGHLSCMVVIGLLGEKYKKSKKIQKRGV